MKLNTILDIPFFYNLTQLVLGMNFFSVAADLIKTYEHKSVLELGCGTGEILKHIRPSSYLGLDINKHYIRHAKTRFENTNIHFWQIDAKKIPKVNGYFDLVIIINVIHHLSDSELKTILKSIKKNVNFGRILLLDSKPSIGPFSILLEKADQGDHFRNLQQIKKIFAQFFAIERADLIKRFYWLYTYPMIVAKKK